MDPDVYDRLMGISSVNPSERGRFGDGALTSQCLQRQYSLVRVIVGVKL